MKKNRKIKIQFTTLSFLFIMLISSLFLMFPMNNSNSKKDSISKNNDDKNELDPRPINEVESPKSSKISNDPWCSKLGAWRYRKLINITNPNLGITFTNYTTSLVFNYTSHTKGGAQYPMNGDLSDIRIVQNDNLRKYWYKKDYPLKDLVTVWFDVDIGQSPNNIDTDHTFLYFNGSGKEGVDPNYIMNKASNDKKDAFGWVRNGNFELDNKTGSKTTELFGWNYTNAMVTTWYSPDPGVQTTNYQYNLTTWNLYQSIVYDKYSFKWGDKDHFLANANNDHDFVGTLYSYPFIVPTLSGTVYNLQLSVFRNVRFYNENKAHPMGYFLRLCQGYTSNVNSHTSIYLKEKWYYTEYKSGGVIYYTYATDGTNVVNTRGPLGYTDPVGDLTGSITINMNNYMGSLLFLEVGTYGKESAFQTAFTQVDNIAFNYNILTALNAETQVVAGGATFITKDVDGRIVPNAKVTIIDSFKQKIGPYSTSEQDGLTQFNNVPYGQYNVTVNYTLLYAGLEKVVYNSSVLNKNYLIDGTGKIFEIIVNLTTIDFEVVDYGGYPLTYGYINITKSKDSPTLDILQLKNGGKATFRWLNTSFYYCQIYYNNTDYSLNPTLLNSSYIYRDQYAIWPTGKKYQNCTFDINNRNQSPIPGFFNIKERFYTNGSTTKLSDIKLINASITITNDQYLKNVSIYYIDSSNNTGTLNHRIFYKDGYVGTTSDKIAIDLMTVVNSKLSGEKRLAYGLYIDIWGVNSSVCIGTIKINTSETWHVFNRTIISKLNVRVLGNGATISDAIVSIKSNSTIFGQIVKTTLISNKNKNSYTFSDNGLPFMYLRGYYYNFSVVWGEPPDDKHQFSITVKDPDQWAPSVNVLWYNYSLLGYNISLEFNINMETINPTQWNLKFDNLSAPESVVWCQNVTVRVYFNSTKNAWSSYTEVIAPDEIKLEIKSGLITLFSFNMIAKGLPGYYIKEFNSSILSAGIGGEFYKIVISGYNSPYNNPSDESMMIFIAGKNTVLSLHDYDTLNVIPSFEVSQHFGELINITIKYYNDTNNPIIGATIAFDWLNLGYNYTGFQSDPLHPGYYTVTLDTSKAETLGPRTIKTYASKENYTFQIVLITLRITERPTALNGKTGLFYISQHVYIKDSYNFSFIYTDVLTGGNKIGNIDVYSYTWQEIGAGGTPISGREGSGILVEINQEYILDFDTEKKAIGIYLLYVTVQKDNYEVRTAVVNLVIDIRQLDYEIDATNFKDDQINVVKGKKIKFEITLIDTSRNIPLTGAKVTLEFNDKDYDFDEESPGFYTLTLETKDIDAYFSSQTFTSTITIEKEDFDTEEYDLTIVVEMEEIFPGISAFYFWLVLAAISGVFGSLIGYKIVQQARIPIFVKKVRKVSKAIKTNKSIPLISIPTKEEMFLQDFGRDWSEIGLDLKDILGVKETKSGTLSKAKDLITKRGETE